MNEEFDVYLYTKSIILFVQIRVEISDSKYLLSKGFLIGMVDKSFVSNHVLFFKRRHFAKVARVFAMLLSTASPGLRQLKNRRF